MKQIAPTIRRADSNDLDQLVQLRVNMLRDAELVETESDAAAITKAIQRYFAQQLPSGIYTAWVAEAEGYIVAASGLVFLERPSQPNNLSGREAYIMSMYTLPQWRKKGIATALMEALIAFARANDARCIWLHTTEAGKAIYSKVGFKPTSTEMELMLTL